MCVVPRSSIPGLVLHILKEGDDGGTNPEPRAWFTRVNGRLLFSESTKTLPKGQTALGLGGALSLSL
ncbi:MAG: hypothetical protein D6684_03440 [Deinococcus-Thermus bacterium]|nr:MAG: hypothetical protein D6684_03440 [Deinococcota bacterium]